MVQLFALEREQLEARTRELAGFVLPKITTQVVSHRDYSRRFAFTATLLVGSAKNRTAQAPSNLACAHPG